MLDAVIVENYNYTVSMVTGLFSSFLFEGQTLGKEREKERQR